MIQHIPGSIVCYSDQQIQLLNFTLRKDRTGQATRHGPSCLFIGCLFDAASGPVVSTTIDGKCLYLMELSTRNPLNDNNYADQNRLIPLSSCVLTNPFAKSNLNQWLSMLLESAEAASSLAQRDADLYIVCDNSMALVEAILANLNRENFEEYARRLFVVQASKLPDTDEPFAGGVDLVKLNASVIELCRGAPLEPASRTAVVHTCSSQFMEELSLLCKSHYRTENNYTFGLCAFSIVLNSRTLGELQRTLYALMCILYSATINKKVKEASTT